jgi:hypothetical protein
MLGINYADKSRCAISGSLFFQPRMIIIYKRQCRNRAVEAPSYPGRTRRNIEESDGTVIFSLEPSLNRGTKLTRGLADNLGKPVLKSYEIRKERMFNPVSLRLEIEALTDFLCSDKIDACEAHPDWRPGFTPSFTNFSFFH